MKYVIEATVAAKWYLHDQDVVKALRLRAAFHAGFHQLLAPDSLSIDCVGALVQAEKKGIIDSGESDLAILDLAKVGVPLHSVAPLLQRAAAIGLATRLTICASLYVALAEREKCELLTADSKLLRAARKHFPFVTSLATLP